MSDILNRKSAVPSSSSSVFPYSLMKFDCSSVSIIGYSPSFLFAGKEDMECILMETVYFF